MRDTKLLSLIVGFILLTPFYTNAPITSLGVARAARWASDWRPHGAYVDEIMFVVYTEGEVPLAMLALQNGDIDCYDEQILNDYQWDLIIDEDIEVTFTPSVRYRTLILNCNRFPTNITAFRRAIAFGFDKYHWDPAIGIGGLVQPQDSYIPLILTEWEVESKLPTKFYEADFIEGNKSLVIAGFKDLDNDGWREYDKNGNGQWDAAIDYDDTDPLMCIELNFNNLAIDPVFIDCDLATKGLRRMGIHSTIVGMDFDQLCDRMTRTQHSVVCWTENVCVVNPVKLLYERFATKGSLNGFYYHFNNATIDAELEAMVTATNITTVKHHALEAHKMLVFEQPQIVVVNGVIIGAYRTDKFEGFFEFIGFGTSSGENNYAVTKVHLKEALGGPHGGTFKYGLSGNMGTLNPYLQRTKYEATVFQYIYEKLWNIDPYTWDLIPGLAYDWDIEETRPNGDIRDGQKFTFYLYENETWHDGTPFTAADVNHSMYMYRTSPYHPPEMEDIYKVEIPDDYTIEIFVNKIGYFEWADTTAFYITPEHIWREVENITTYSPTLAEVIGTGPYKLDAWVPGESIRLLRHEDWRWDIREVLAHTTSSTHTESITSLTTHTTSHSSIHSSTSSTQLDTPLNLLPFVQMLGLGTILFFVVTLVITIRRQKMD